MNITKQGLGYVYDAETDFVYLYFKVDKAIDNQGKEIPEPLYCELKMVPVAGEEVEKTEDYPSMVEEVKNFFFDHCGPNKVVSPITREEYLVYQTEAEEKAKAISA